MTCVTWPMFLAVGLWLVLVAMFRLLGLARDCGFRLIRFVTADSLTSAGAADVLVLERLDAADDFHDLAGDLRLAGAVVGHRQAA